MVSSSAMHRGYATDGQTSNHYLISPLYLSGLTSHHMYLILLGYLQQYYYIQYLIYIHCMYGTQYRQCQHQQYQQYTQYVYTTWCLCMSLYTRCIHSIYYLYYYIQCIYSISLERGCASHLISSISSPRSHPKISSPNIRCHLLMHSISGISTYYYQQYYVSSLSPLQGIRDSNSSTYR